ncbi:hypothetical protein JYT86_00830, partial [bacterium AH-315-N03]|nr:hypothetical protein [bacterium AH-315-N03]
MTELDTTVEAMVTTMADPEWTRELFDRLVRNIKANVPVMLLRDGHLEPGFFIAANTNPETNRPGPCIVQGKLESIPREMVPAFLQQYCRDLDASGVLHIAGVWSRDLRPEQVRER